MRNVLSPCVVFGLVIAGSTWLGGHHVVYRFILPKDYVGWVRVDFGVRDAPELDVEDIRTGMKVTVIVPRNGVVETSTLDVHSTWESYELYYRDEDRLVRIPKEFYSSKWMLGGFGGTLRDDSGKPKAACWYFMIGPKSLRAKHPIEAYLKEGAEPPKPGPLPTATPPT